MWFSILSCIAGLTGLYYGTYNYLKVEHNNRMINALKTLLQTETALDKPIIQKYVKGIVETMA